MTKEKITRLSVYASEDTKTLHRMADISKPHLTRDLLID